MSPERQTHKTKPYLFYLISRSLRAAHVCAGKPTLLEEVVLVLGWLLGMHFFL